MSLWSRIFHKNRYGFKEEDRDKATVAHTLSNIRKQQLKILQDKMNNLQAMSQEQQIQDQIDMLERQVYGDDNDNSDDYDNDDNVEDKLFGRLIDRAFPVESQESKLPNSVKNKTSFTDEEIEEMLSMFKQSHIEKARKMSPQSLSKLIRSQIPNIDDDSLRRAVGMIKGVIITVKP